MVYSTVNLLYVPGAMTMTAALVSALGAVSGMGKLFKVSSMLLLVAVVAGRELRSMPLSLSNLNSPLMALSAVTVIFSNRVLAMPFCLV